MQVGALKIVCSPILDCEKTVTYYRAGGYKARWSIRDTKQVPAPAGYQVGDVFFCNAVAYATIRKALHEHETTS